MERYFKHLKTYFTHKSSIAVGFAFILMGVLFGSWATFIPYKKNEFQLDDAQLGILLLCLPIGATFFNPMSALIIRKMGMKKATLMGMILLPIIYILPLFSQSPITCGMSLFLTGILIAQLNVAMNTCAVAIEETENINIMSTSHGMFSVGLMVGSLASGISLDIGLIPYHHMTLLAILFTIVTWFLWKYIDAIKDPHQNKEVNDTSSKKVSKEIKVALALMVAISICSNITEGSMADWTAVYMQEIVIAPAYMIGWGLSGYSFFMSLGRFFGDGLIPKFGGNKMLLAGSVFVTIGLLITIVFPTKVLSIAGFSLVGFGISFSAPILYASASKIPGYGNGKGLAIMNTFGMVGFLGGPVVIGFLSRTFSLPMAFVLLLFLALIWGTLTHRLKLY